MSQKMELAALLSAVIRDDPKAVEFLPLNETFIEGVRQNEKRPAWFKSMCPDGWIVNLMKNQKLLDGFVLVRVDREFIEQWLKNTEQEKANESKQNPEPSGSGELCSESGEGSLPG